MVAAVWAAGMASAVVNGGVFTIHFFSEYDFGCGV
jgi:hypothetical protein